MKPQAMDGGVDVDIHAISTAGDGIGRLGGREITVPFTIPGERVRVLPNQGSGGGARLLQVLHASPHRVVARCAHFGPHAEPGLGPCGGCSWQHISYAEQLRLKSTLVDDVVRRAVRSAPRARATIPGTDPDNPWGYRRKVHFVFGNANRSARDRRPTPLVMGHYVRGTRRIIPVRECPVHDEAANAIAFGLRDACARSAVSAAATDGPGTLRSIAIRAGRHTPELMATVVASDPSDKRLRRATQRVMEDNPGAGWHLNLHPREDGFIFGPDTRRLAGPERMRDEVAGSTFLISPTAFFQTNVDAAETLVGLVLDSIPEPSLVLDLYAGAGLFAIPLARAGHDVVAVEENRAAVLDGEASLRLNRVTAGRCRFLATRAEAALRAIPRADVVVLDPPRDGCTPEVLDGVFRAMRPDRAIYVSCNPEALGRDLDGISEEGYGITLVQPVDMFPHTAHVETVVVLDRSPQPRITRGRRQ